MDSSYMAVSLMASTDGRGRQAAAVAAAETSRHIAAAMASQRPSPAVPQT